MPAIPGLRSSYEQTRGIVYFARMLDKIRLQAAGTLPAGYLLGDDQDPTWFDGRICRFLGVRHSQVREWALAGLDDEAVLERCFQEGRKPNDEEILIFNSFLSKRGWRDPATPGLEKEKSVAGLGDRTDIKTFFDLQDAEEGREPRFRD